MVSLIFTKEVPTDINKTEEYEYDHHGIHIKGSVIELMEWIKLPTLK